MRISPSRVAAVCAGALLLAGGVLTGARSAAQPTAPTVRVTERDFAVSMAKAKTVHAGDVRFVVHNRGPDSHEFIVVRAASLRLPLRRDGQTVDEDALRHAEVGSLEPAGPGAARELRLHLAPGRYVLFCNMEGHFLGGMHAELVVRR